MQEVSLNDHQTDLHSPTVCVCAFPIMINLHLTQPVSRPARRGVSYSIPALVTRCRNGTVAPRFVSANKEKIKRPEPRQQVWSQSEVKMLSYLTDHTSQIQSRKFCWQGVGAYVMVAFIWTKCTLEWLVFSQWVIHFVLSVFLSVRWSSQKRNR